MSRLIPLFCCLLLPSATTADERRMVITFDDLPAQRAAGLPEDRIAEITERLVALMVERRIPAIGFVNERKLEIDGQLDEGRRAMLVSWLEAGLELGNHSYSHPDLHQVPVEDFLADIERGERVTRPLLQQRGLEPRFFRHPFLHTGTDLETRETVAHFLAGRGYRIAPVTIDNSEWIYARAYDDALDRGDSELAQRLGASYVDYMLAITEYYEGQSRALFDREIPQVLLLHANAVNAHHLAPLVDGLEARGYRFIDLETALQDPAFDSPDEYVGPGGITWLHRWALTRDVDRSIFAGEPTTPEWVQEVAGLRESPRAN